MPGTITRPPFIIHDDLTMLARGKPWHLADFDLPANQNDGNLAVWGVIDTGIDDVHGFDGGKLANNIADMKDFTGSRRGSIDALGHGTHVAGVICQIAPMVKLMVAKALGDDGFGEEQWVADAIDWCREQGCHGVNLSLGSHVVSIIIRATVDRFILSGGDVVCAAGNGGPNHTSDPASHAPTISVAASDRQERPAGFSEPSAVDIAAPGVHIDSLYLFGGRKVMSGTSMAAPNVSASIATYVGKEIEEHGKRKTGPKEMRALLESTAKDIHTPGEDEKTGHGLITPRKFWANIQGPPSPIGRGVVIRVPENMIIERE